MPHMRALSFLIGFAWVMILTPLHAAEKTVRPNIIFVLTDDQGYGDLGFTGNPILHTPNIDAFARQSVRFTDFHVSPTCAPTRSALMTGRHEFKNGVTHTINERERMRGEKAMPYQGGTRVPSFWRWPAAFKGDRDCAALTAQIDVFPTLAEIAGASLSADVKEQVEGRSLVPLLNNSQTDWPDRILVTHVGRWERGAAAQAKFQQCSIRDARFTLVNNAELYDLRADPGETRNLITGQPAEVAKLRAAYDHRWDSVQSLLVNENVTGPKENPFAALYREQFGSAAR